MLQSMRIQMLKISNLKKNVSVKMHIYLLHLSPPYSSLGSTAHQKLIQQHHWLAVLRDKD